jgi:hypothetical protein
MSDPKPKRAAREPAPSETPAAEALAEAAGITDRNAAPQPEPVSTIALATAAPVGPPHPAETVSAPPARDDVPEAVAADGWAALAEAQTALARGFEEAAVAMAGISRSGMAATTDAAVALLGARTVAEAVEINAGLARRGLDAMLEGSAKLSEIGASALADASRPLLTRFGRDWSAFGTGTG